MKLAGKTAIVTGGGRDVGAAAAIKLAAEGAKVAINYYASSEEADNTVATIEAAGGQAFAMQGDLKSEADVAQLVSKTLDAFGSIDVLVNNAPAASLQSSCERPDRLHC